MNLIYCDKDCIYQADGGCTLDGISTINSVSDNECCHFKKKQKEKAHSNKTSINSDSYFR